MKQILGLLLVGLMASPATAQIAVDGTRDAGYGGPALVLIGPSGLPSTAVQTVDTGFGDNESEWDAEPALPPGRKRKRERNTSGRASP